MIHESIKLKTAGSEEGACLETYILEDYLDVETSWKRPLVLICPGGAYRMTSNREAEPVALQFSSMGYHSAVLRYSCAPAVYPTALHELALAVRIIREKAEEWHVDGDKLVILGFSAGGHLAASYGAFWQEEHMREAAGCKRETLRPDGLILCYPVISSEPGITHEESMKNLLGGQEELREKMSLENQAGPQVPKTFLWHTQADQSVPFWNSLRFVQALAKAGVSVEFHLFPDGKHGISLAREMTSEPDKSAVEEGCQSWLALAQSWLMRNYGL